MFEEMTYEKIMERMLSRVPDALDKREGAIIFDALAPAAFEMSILYTELETALDQTFADTCQGVYLDKRCMERGITRQPATHAIVQGTFKPTDLDLSGLRFNCGDYNYTVKEPIGNGVYEMVCETAGSLPNGISGQLIPIDYINGLETAEITAILIPGENEESDEDLRSRYFDTLVSQAYGGNITDYKQKTNAIEGVGGVKVTPVWNGGGTVKLTIIASDL
ncbi:MAG: baseplate J/gp47 family protein [Roseburia inulinivorans]